METFSTNPVKTLSVDELNEFLEAINKNFKVVKNLGSMDIDLHTRWFDLHTNCLRYAYLNHEFITEKYPKMEDRSYGDIIKIMIQEELKTR
jgi:hypothetical protein